MQHAARGRAVQRLVRVLLLPLSIFTLARLSAGTPSKRHG
jgi:hypothetical protein